jgi:hypothetical protein
MNRILSRIAAAAALVIAAALGACNPIPPEIRFAAATAFTPEWCQAAKSFPNNGGYLHAVGQCHERGVEGFAKDPNVFTYYYSQAARWGNTDAGAALARLGEPVPDSDLYREWQARQERERNTRTIASAIRATAPPPRQQPTLIRTPTVTPVVTPVRPPPVVAPPQGPRNYHRSGSETVNQRRVCTNNICRTERTTCTNGVCNTTIINN